jgi:hypothetical protein
MIAPKPQNPKKKKGSAAAQEAEAGDGYVTIEQCGVTLRIPLGGKMPYKSLRAFQSGDEELGTELLLGEKQWAALMAKNPTIDDMNEIGTKIQESVGN